MCTVPGAKGTLILIYASEARSPVTALESNVEGGWAQGDHSRPGRSACSSLVYSYMDSRALLQQLKAVRTQGGELAGWKCGKNVLSWHRAGGDL